MKISVAKLNSDLKSEDLYKVFQLYGKVVYANIIRDQFTGRSKGYGFVEMANDEEAVIAIYELNGAELHGRSLLIRKVKLFKAPR